MEAMLSSTHNIFCTTLSSVLSFTKKHYILISTITLAGIGTIIVKKIVSGRNCESRARLDGKTVIVTGSNSGIGKETARDLASRGAKVILACRDITKAERAAQDIRKSTGNNNVSVRVVDLASFKSIRKFVKEIIAKEEALHILVNNAGVGPTARYLSEDAFHLQLAVNHLGPFLLTNLLLELLKKSAPSRIVTVSSMVHEYAKINLEDINLENGFHPWTAYIQSKLANILFTRGLHQRLKGTGVTAYAVHPGAINTKLNQEMKVVVSRMEYFFCNLMLRLIGISVIKGAQTSVFCAVQEGIESHSGQYFSNCKLARASSLAEDDETADTLWKLTEQLTKTGN